jgi:hypothetical protein
LGNNDSLRIFVSEIGTSINVEVDLVVDLPDKLVYADDLIHCTRLFDDPAAKDCEILSKYESGAV